MGTTTSPFVIVITGTSRGLGAHLRRALGDAGHRVYGSSRSGEPDDAHVTDPAQCEAAVAEVLAREGHIDVLINNAGSHLFGAAVEVGAAELRGQLELNFYGAVHMTRAVLPSMLAAGRGRIINISSIGGRLATPFTSAYAASKFALEGYMEALRLELLPFGVFVSNLEPGFLRTGTTAQSVVPTQGFDPRFTALREATHAKLLHDAAAGLELEQVAAAIEQILAARRPRLRYSVDGLVVRLTWLRQLLGSTLFERIVVRATAPALRGIG